MKNLNYQKLVKMASSDKGQIHTGYTLSLCLVITDSKLTQKIYQHFSKSEHQTYDFLMKNKSSIHFDNARIISAKVNYFEKLHKCLLFNIHSFHCSFKCKNNK